MLFWLILIVLVTGLGIFAWSQYTCKYDKPINFVGVLMSVIGMIATAISIICLLGNYCGVNAEIAKYKERYKAITYKIESDTCRDEFGLLNKEVIDEIQDWNEDITYKKNAAHNFWIGIYNPDTFDQFNTIDYEEYGE